MKKCSASLLIRELHIKPTMSYHLTLVRMAIIKKSTSSKCWKGSGKREMSYTVGNANWYMHYGEQCGDYLKKKKKKLGIELPEDAAIPLLGIHPEEIIIERDTCTLMFFTALLQWLGNGSELDVHQQINVKTHDTGYNGILLSYKKECI